MEKEGGWPESWLESVGSSWEWTGMIEGERNGPKVQRWAGMNTWICKCMEAFRSSSFPLQPGWIWMCGCIWDCVYVCVCGRTHACVPYDHEFCVPLAMCVDYCMCLCLSECVCVLACVYIVCSGGWAPLPWQLPAAKGLERWHCWNGADLFVSVRARLCYSALVSAMNRMRVVCVSWVWKGIESDYRKYWHQINSDPHMRGRKWKKGESCS